MRATLRLQRAQTWRPQPHRPTERVCCAPFPLPAACLPPRVCGTGSKLKRGCLEDRHLERQFTRRALAAIAGLAGCQPVDAIVLQETKMTDDKFPHAAIEEAGYAVQWFGQKTYNGVALLSRSPACDIQRNIRVMPMTPRASSLGPWDLSACLGGYFPNGQAQTVKNSPTRWLG